MTLSLYTNAKQYAYKHKNTLLVEMTATIKTDSMTYEFILNYYSVGKT